MSSGDSHVKNAVLEETGEVRARGPLGMKTMSAATSPGTLMAIAPREAGRAKECARVSEETTGFPGENGPYGHMPGAAVERPPLPVWVSEALLAETVEVWSEMYGGTISQEEALEILTNVQRLGEALFKAKREMRG